MRKLIYLIILFPSLLSAGVTSVITQPGNPRNSVQYNDNGVFGGSTTFKFNEATGILTIPKIQWPDGTIQISSPTFEGIGGIFISTSIHYIQNSLTPTTTTQQFNVNLASASILRVHSAAELHTDIVFRIGTSTVGYISAPSLGTPGVMRLTPSFETAGFGLEISTLTNKVELRDAFGSGPLDLKFNSSGASNDGVIRWVPGSKLFISSQAWTFSSTMTLSGSRVVANTSPADGQALVWSSSNTRWEPGTVSGAGVGDISAVIAGFGLLGGASTGDATLALDGNTTSYIQNRFVTGVNQSTAAFNISSGTFNGPIYLSTTNARLSIFYHTQVGTDISPTIHSFAPNGNSNYLRLIASSSSTYTSALTTAPGVAYMLSLIHI